MMTSEKNEPQVYVWIWLPGQTEPVVAGALQQEGEETIFAYGKSYLAREDAIAIYEPELPLRSGAISPPDGLKMPNCIRDSSPDAWGRRVIINRKFGKKEVDADNAELSELTYLLESGSDRTGALDFQKSATVYVPRQKKSATLEELLRSAKKVENGIPLTPELDAALQHGSSIGGARPKALIDDGDRKYIAKFSGSSDTYSVVKIEFLAMRLAKYVGLDVAPVKLTRASGKDVLLIERFDRIKANNGWNRRAMVSALTLLGLDEMMAQYASYSDLAETIRHRFTDPEQTLKELFSRMVFNVLCGNTDDHARNHAAFWDGKNLSLTPAYDICPQSRTGNEASQAMLITDESRMSQIVNCIAAAPVFLLNENMAIEIINSQIEAIIANWKTICEKAGVSDVERNLFWRRQFLNPYIFDGAPADVISTIRL
jgi:serine/threonine-protein kinase HipA